MENRHRLIMEKLLMTTGCCENDSALEGKLEQWGKEVHMQQISLMYRVPWEYFLKSLVNQLYIYFWVVQ